MREPHLIQACRIAVNEEAQVVLGLPQQAVEGVNHAAQISGEKVEWVVVAEACDAPLQAPSKPNPQGQAGAGWTMQSSGSLEFKKMPI